MVDHSNSILIPNPVLEVKQVSVLLVILDPQYVNNADVLFLRSSASVL